MNLNLKKLLKKQIPFLIEKSRKHTEIGLYINFQVNEDIEKYKISTLRSQNFDIEGNVIEMIN